MEKKERRSKKKRRINTKRRIFDDPDYNGPESRSVIDGRSGKDRRDLEE